MDFSKQIKDFVLSAPNKALATTNKDSVNVVPVSTMRIVDNKILLMNYFMSKTLNNIKQNPRVSLVCWEKLNGYQIKGSVEYVDKGEAFEDAEKWIESNVPNRKLNGLLVITPEEIYDISPKI